jgi:hypothetical protein
MTPVPGLQYKLVHDGNSIVYGYALANRNTRYSIQLQAMLNQSRFRTTGDGIPAYTTNQIYVAFTTVEGHPGMPHIYEAPPINSILIAWELTNDIRIGLQTDTQALSNWANYVTLARSFGYKVWSLTCLPSTAFLAGEEVYRQSVNVSMRANASRIYGDRIIDAAALPQLQDPNDTTYYVDGTHPTVAGHTLLAKLLFLNFKSAHIC